MTTMPMILSEISSKILAYLSQSRRQKKERNILNYKYERLEKSNVRFLDEMRCEKININMLGV